MCITDRPAGNIEAFSVLKGDWTFGGQDRIGGPSHRGAESGSESVLLPLNEYFLSSIDSSSYAADHGADFVDSQETFLNQPFPDEWCKVGHIESRGGIFHLNQDFLITPNWFGMPGYPSERAEFSESSLALLEAHSNLETVGRLHLALSL